MRNKKIYPLVLVFLFLAAWAQAKDIYVDQTQGNDANSGLSWTEAKATIPAALEIAVNGDVVHVAEGTYIGTVSLKSGVSLLGGYPAGGGTRDATLYKSILDGNYQGSVVKAVDVTGFVLDGFVVVHGQAGSGGGIFIRDSQGNIQNNEIKNNRASQGGGIYVDDFSGSISQNEVYSNSAGTGGGIKISASSGAVGNNYLHNNSAGAGGGIYAAFCDSQFKIAGNRIVQNTAYISGGGVYLADFGGNL